MAKILVIDDESTILQNIKFLLEIDGNESTDGFQQYRRTQDFYRKTATPSMLSLPT